MKIITIFLVFISIISCTGGKKEAAVNKKLVATFTNLYNESFTIVKCDEIEWVFKPDVKIITIYDELMIDTLEQKISTTKKEENMLSARVNLKIFYNDTLKTTVCFNLTGMQVNGIPIKYDKDLRDYILEIINYKKYFGDLKF